jgi:hypothetical protein
MAGWNGDFGEGRREGSYTSSFGFVTEMLMGLRRRKDSEEEVLCIASDQKFILC